MARSSGLQIRSFRCPLLPGAAVGRLNTAVFMMEDRVAVIAPASREGVVSTVDMAAFLTGNLRQEHHVVQAQH